MEYQLMWANLKKYILTKNSHGKNELMNAMVNIEIEESQRFVEELVSKDA